MSDPGSIPTLTMAFIILAFSILNTLMLLQWPNMLVAAQEPTPTGVYIGGYLRNQTYCLGSRVVCPNIPSRTCCNFLNYTIKSVLIWGLQPHYPECDSGRAFYAKLLPEKPCTTNLLWSTGGRSSVCFRSGGFLWNGAGFVRQTAERLIGPYLQLKCPDSNGLANYLQKMKNGSSSSSSSSVASSSSSSCSQPTSLGYSSNYSHGEWVIRSTPDRIHALSSQLEIQENDAGADVEEWLKSKGALYHLAQNSMEPTIAPQQSSVYLNGEVEESKI